MLQRLCNLQSKIRRDRSSNHGSWKKKIYRINIFPGEHAVNIDYEFEDDIEDPELRHWRNAANQLNDALCLTQSALNNALTNTSSKQREICSLGEQNQELRERNQNLTNRLSSVEQEVDESAENNRKLQARVDEMEKEKNKEQRAYGRKPIGELCPSQVKATKQAFRNQFKDAIDSYGSNRGLVMESITLRDHDGERLIVNAERPHTYENLNRAEKTRVAQTSQWKDLNRVSDRVYSSLAKNTSLPPAAHLKKYETALNATLPPISEVNGIIWAVHNCLGATKQLNKRVHPSIGS